MTSPQFPLPFATRPSSVHGLGAFTTGLIRAGAEFVQYSGEKITKAESLRRCEADNTFIFQLDDDWDVDGNVSWNPARFLNHSCAPNCDAELIDDEIWIVARRDIAVGEELTFNYGYDLEQYRDYPCRCGASECVGYIVAEEFFPLLRQRQQNAVTANGALSPAHGPPGPL
jgi:SET domain-containing protein